jgi:Mg/Co/Ni transporter MgtE
MGTIKKNKIFDIKRSIESSFSKSAFKALESSSTKAMMESLKKSASFNAMKAFENSASIRAFRALENTSALAAIKSLENSTVFNTIKTLENSGAMSAFKTLENSPAITGMESFKNSAAFNAMKALENSTVMNAFKSIENSSAIAAMKSLEKTTVFNTISVLDDNAITSAIRSLENSPAIAAMKSFKNSTVFSLNSVLKNSSAMSAIRALEDTSRFSTFNELAKNLTSRFAAPLTLSEAYQVVTEEYLNTIGPSETERLDALSDKLEIQLQKSPNGALSKEFYLSLILTFFLFWLSQISSIQSEKKILTRIEQVETTISQELAALKKFENIETFYVVNRAVNLRVKPTTKSEVITILYPNEKVRLIQRKSKWIKVEYFNYSENTYTSGWVYKKYLKILNLAKY